MPDQTPAQELTAAAQRLRWLLHEDGMPEQIRRPWLVPSGGTYGRITAPGQDVPVAQALWGGVAEYVAAMHPGVGLALAGWLDATVAEMQAADGTEYAYEEFASWTAALAVARAINGQVTQ